MPVDILTRFLSERRVLHDTCAVCKQEPRYDVYPADLLTNPVRIGVDIACGCGDAGSVFTLGPMDWPSPEEVAEEVAEEASDMFDSQ